MKGAINLTAPNPVQNADFTKVLGGLMRTWITVPVPSFIIGLLVGELADEILLVSQAAHATA